ncbi:MAG: hypothetical protein AB8F65_06005 [Woeseiaceae bacterium]
MPKSKPLITERQQHWLDHIKAADASDDSLVAYAAAHKLKVKYLYQWKTLLVSRGFLPGKSSKSSFVPVSTRPAAAPCTSCNITLPNGVRLEFSGELNRTSLGEIITAASALT